RRHAPALLVGIGVPRHSSARRARARAGDRARPEPRQRDERPGRQPRRRRVGDFRRRTHRLDQLRLGPQRGDDRDRARGHLGRRPRNPLSDLHAAARRTFWVAAVAGIIVFGSLMAAMFIGQQFLQNVLGYSTLQAGAAILPAVFLMVLVAPRSAKLVESHGARFTLLLGYVFVLLGFLTMYALWDEGTPYWEVGLAYAFVGIGVGFAGTPASHSLTGSVPVKRAGMASGTADLQRDLGGAIMQSILGALLTAGYSAAVASAIAAAPNGNQINDKTEAQLEQSFAGAEN